PGMAVADHTAAADQDESWHPCVNVDQSEPFVLDVLACGIQVFRDVVPPRTDLVLGVARFLEPFAVRGERTGAGTFQLDECPPDADRVGLRDEKVGHIAATEPQLGTQPAPMPTDEYTGEQMRMVLEVQLD